MLDPINIIFAVLAKERQSVQNAARLGTVTEWQNEAKCPSVLQ